MNGGSPVAELIARSNRLGSDPRNTNYAGGNTSAKGTATDPVTGQDVELMWVKGSGGDLGTLRPAGLAVLRLDRLRALVNVYPGVDREDEMVAAFDFCLHGKGGAAPSIDTAMHGLVNAPHVDHLHPDSGIALATAADGEKLTAECFGDRVAKMPWHCPRPSGWPAPRNWLRSSAAWPAPTGRRSATTPTPRWCSTSSPGPSTRGWPRWVRRARITSCGPRCGPWYSTCHPEPPSTR